MDGPTPNAGPAGYTTERLQELVTEARAIVANPQSLLLATRDHLVALDLILRQQAASRAEAARLALAMLIEREHGAVIPNDFLDELAASGAGLVVQRDEKHTRVTVAMPPQPKGRPS